MCPLRAAHSALRVRLVKVIPAADTRKIGRWHPTQPRTRGRRRAAGLTINTASRRRASRVRAQRRGAHTRSLHTRAKVQSDGNARTHAHALTRARIHARTRAHAPLRSPLVPQLYPLSTPQVPIEYPSSSPQYPILALYHPLVLSSTPASTHCSTPSSTPPTTPDRVRPAHLRQCSPTRPGGSRCRRCRR